jgi:hypothetical protein
MADMTLNLSQIVGRVELPKAGFHLELGMMEPSSDSRPSGSCWNFTGESGG